MRLPPRPDQGTNPTKLEWSTRTRPDYPVRDLDNLPGPRSVSFAGVRFRLDRKLQYISWMGWGMYFGFERDMGLSIWDLRFRSERIVYEVCSSISAATIVLIFRIGSWPHKRQSHSMVRDLRSNTECCTHHISPNSWERPNAE